MRKIITLIALVDLICGGWLYAQETEKPVPKEKTVTLTGIIRNDMAAIGGEITRFVLQKDKEGMQQLDHSEVGDLTKYVGKKVKVMGTIYYKEYIERGRTPILRIRTIELLPTQEEKPSEKREISPELEARIEELIKQLGDEDWTVRDKAEKELTNIGQPALFPLIDALSSEDPEVGMRTKRVLLELEPYELNEAEVASIEKRIKEAKDENKDFLQEILGKWQGFIVNGLQATIKSDKKTYKVGEKITIEFRLTNVSEKEIYIAQKCSGFSKATFCIDKLIGPAGIIRPPATEHADFSQRPPPLTTNDFFFIKPKEIYKKTIGGSGNTIWSATSIHNNDSYNLDQVGKYKITMFYLSDADGTEAKLKTKAWTGKILSNTITIEIKE